MKIVFWSEEAACGTTSNMIATASMIVARHNCRVAMLSAEKNAHDLAGNFSRPDSVTVNEDCAYYALEGFLSPSDKNRRASVSLAEGRKVFHLQQTVKPPLNDVP